MSGVCWFGGRQPLQEDRKHRTNNQNTNQPNKTAWFIAAPLLGGYGRDARGGATGAAALAAAKVWALAAPLGLAFRAASKGYAPPVPFIIVSLVATAVFMIGWRTALAAATPDAKAGGAGAGGSGPAAAAAAAKQRKDKRGNPLEFISLLVSLTKRW
jgi:hypothetical protein